MCDPWQGRRRAAKVRGGRHRRRHAPPQQLRECAEAEAVAGDGGRRGQEGVVHGKRDGDRGIAAASRRHARAPRGHRRRDDEAAVEEEGGEGEQVWREGARGEERGCAASVHVPSPAKVLRSVQRVFRKQQAACTFVSGL